MRNPNGYGGVTKLPGKRRKPYRARVTDHWEDGKQIYKTIGYFDKRKDAIEALAAYHNNPTTFDNLTVTFGEVYDMWSGEKFKKISHSNVNGYQAAYKLCDSIKGMRMADIKTAHLQNVVDNCGKNYPTLRKLKVLFTQIYGYAVQNDIVEKDYATFVKIEEKENEPKLDRAPFTAEEINTLWDNLDRHEWIDTILIMIYTGLRIGELLAILTVDINLTEKYMRGGSKTKAGKNRVIPLNDRIIPLIEKRYNTDNNLLIQSPKGGALSYYTYRDVHWANAMDQLKMTHLPHDCRHTFATQARLVGMDELSRKRIMGHASKDLTDRVYTHVEIEELIREVNKLS